MGAGNAIPHVGGLPVDGVGEEFQGAGEFIWNSQEYGMQPSIPPEGAAHCFSKSAGAAVDESAFHSNAGYEGLGR